jgi:hypothetical protein
MNSIKRFIKKLLDRLVLNVSLLDNTSIIEDFSKQKQQTEFQNNKQG